jgi:hypothetical protein
LLQNTFIARSSASFTSKARGRPIAIVDLQFCSDHYISLLTGCVQTPICIDRYRIVETGSMARMQRVVRAVPVTVLTVAPRKVRVSKFSGTNGRAGFRESRRVRT